MDNCCCCSFYLHIHLFATPTTWHLVWYHVECRDIHASSHTQDWCPATLWFWLLVWIIILQRHIFLDYLPPLSLIEETFRLCWQFAKQNQEANRLAMRLHELLKTATTNTWQDNLNRFWHFLIYKSIRTVHWRTWTTIIIKDNQLERHKMDFFLKDNHGLTKIINPPPPSESISRPPKRLKPDCVISSQSRKVLPSPIQEKKSNPVISSCLVAYLHTQIEPHVLTPLPSLIGSLLPRYSTHCREVGP